MVIRVVVIVLYVVAALLPVIALLLALRAARAERRQLESVKPGTIADLSLEFDVHRRASLRVAGTRRALVDVVLVGGGVVLASVGGVLSLYMPAA